MNARAASLYVVLALLLISFGLAVAGPASDGIIITGAREVKESSVGLPQPLQTSLGAIGTRFELWLVDQIRPINMTSIPTTLRAQLSQLPNRIIIQQPKAYRRFQPVYPVALFNDKAAPFISGIAVIPANAGTVTVVWLTDEYATSEVAYGTQSGRYERTVSDPLFVVRHEMTLSGLTPGATYFFVVRSTDRSGNTATSSEGIFTTRVVSFLPLIRRR